MSEDIRSNMSQNWTHVPDLLRPCRFLYIIHGPLILFRLSFDSPQSIFLIEIYSGCPWGWKQSNKKCYKYFPNHVTWYDAQRKCETVEVGAYLASIKSSSEEDFINELTSGTSIWLGGSDRFREGDWKWLDRSRIGSYSQYTHWNTGGIFTNPQPDGDGDCLYLLQFSETNAFGFTWYTAYWHDRKCSETHPFVCKIDLY